MTKTQDMGMVGQAESDKRREGRWRHKGIDFSIADYNAMLKEQNYCCAICHKHRDSFRRGLFVDHDHMTGAVRGLLCAKCNALLGLSGDSLAVLENAFRYLSAHVYMEFDPLAEYEDAR